jgi:general stress protein CsbA
VKGPDFSRGLRHTEYSLILAAVLLLAAGAVSDSWWLLGVGAWALIAGGLIEMIYRP